MLLACSNMTLPDSWSSSGACHPPCVLEGGYSHGVPSDERGGGPWILASSLLSMLLGGMAL